MHIYQKIRLFALLLFSQLLTISVQAETEGQMARRAEKYFVAKKFTEAAPLYAQLVSSNPKNFRYNYYYGICLLVTAADKNEAIPYLEVAIIHTKTPEDIYYYMGRALHLTYNFEQSIRSFSEFNTMIGYKNTYPWQTSLMISMVNNAMQILDTTKNNQIIETVTASTGDFYKNYVFANPNGKLLTMPDDIAQQSKIQDDVRPMIFLSANGRVMYYSAKSPLTSSYDIFRSEKDFDNNWSAPVRLESPVNSKYDELYPTCNGDGRILYFSSRSHNSTGGFDVFKAYYNTKSNSFSEPQNMGSPVNSPDDDFCFVASGEEGFAYFTSQRATGPGEFTVYKMKHTNTESLPVAINGRFSCIGQPELKEALINVSKQGQEIAKVTTDKSNGTYSIELPGPGKYQFRVEVAGFNSYTQEVVFGEFSDNLFVQDILLSRDYKGLENVAITNRRSFDADRLDASLTAYDDDGESVSGGLTAADLANSAEMITTSDDKVKVPAMPGIHFKVQIGAFRKYEKKEVQKRLAKKVDATKMTSYNDITWLRFFFGDEQTYKSVKNLKQTLIGAGFKDAFVVAFNNDVPMPVNKAIELTTNK
jgi:hypothetical protein